MKNNPKQQISIDSKILKAINAFGHGAVFVPTDFLSFGSRQAVDIVLHRLVRKGTIRRLARGIYDFPEEHPVLGKIQPSPEKIAEALVGRDCTRIQPAGAYAANILGLSEQAAIQRNISPVVMEKDFFCMLVTSHSIRVRVR